MLRGLLLFWGSGYGKRIFFPRAGLGPRARGARATGGGAAPADLRPLSRRSPRARAAGGGRPEAVGRRRRSLELERDRWPAPPGRFSGHRGAAWPALGARLHRL